MTYIKVNNTEYPAEINGNPKDRTWGERDTKTIALTMLYAQAAALLPDNTPWIIVQRDMVDVLDEQGHPTGETKEVVNEYDNSEYSIAGDITDHRDGTVSIKMGKPTESELSAATVTALVGQSITPQRAAKLRPMIEAAATSLPDSDAATAVELFPRWADHIGETVKPGDRRSDTDESGVLHVYRVNKGQGHTTQENWPPHSTPAMWTIINVDHAGTQDDPIPAARGMEYTYGLYYKDPEDTKLYKCERIGEQSGNKITLQYLPHELVGQYFKEATV
ncbi:hypothetical protein [Oscillibacter sp. ER4]|uniref:hypothetical protein n=1 Tax=Oscillibacter sp. ER4 TaxID=1519439 RepID=UPI00051B3273|nr:hypothetical protein [Oscillibacter sp. ER4]